MSVRNLFHPFWLALVLLLVLVSTLACQPQPVATPLPPLPTVDPAAVKPTATAAPKVEATKPAAAPAAKPGTVKTVEDIMKSAPTSPFMDGKHVTKGLPCTACHTAMPPKGAPETKVCLSCHKNSYTAMAEVTVKVNPNPHTSHEGEVPCADCHKGHEPFVYGCGKAGCHTEYSNNRFK